MSEAMAQKKKEDITKFENIDVQIMQEIKEDRCPNCGLPTSQVEFVNMNIIKMFGWVECTRCGNVYCPQSILNQKRTLAKSGLIPPVQPPSIILPA